jgi:hypothetical protein
MLPSVIGGSCHPLRSAYASFWHFFMKLFLPAPLSGFPSLLTAFGSHESFLHFVTNAVFAAPASGFPSLLRARASQALCANAGAARSIEIRPAAMVRYMVLSEFCRPRVTKTRRTMSRSAAGKLFNKQKPILYAGAQTELFNIAHFGAGSTRRGPGFNGERVRVLVVRLVVPTGVAHRRPGCCWPKLRQSQRTRMRFLTAGVRVSIERYAHQRQAPPAGNERRRATPRQSPGRALHPRGGTRDRASRCPNGRAGRSVEGRARVAPECGAGFHAGPAELLVSQSEQFYTVWRMSPN